MKMCDLPGTVYSPLAENERGKVRAISSSDRVFADAGSMEVGQVMVVQNSSIARRLNQKHGLGMFSNKKINGINYLTRNK